MCRLSTSADLGGVYYQQGNGTLVLDRASADNNGIYRCTATNLLGMESARTEIVFVKQSKQKLHYACTELRVGIVMPLKSY